MPCQPSLSSCTRNHSLDCTHTAPDAMLGYASLHLSMQMKSIACSAPDEDRPGAPSTSETRLLNLDVFARSATQVSKKGGPWHSLDHSMHLHSGLAFVDETYTSACTAAGGRHLNQHMRCLQRIIQAQLQGRAQRVPVVMADGKG